jgi:hypothetical protein
MSSAEIWNPGRREWQGKTLMVVVTIIASLVAMHLQENSVGQTWTSRTAE